MLRAPDGHGRLELESSTRQRRSGPSQSTAPVNTLGIRRIMFAVDDIDEVVLARLQAHGAELVGEVVQYED